MHRLLARQLRKHGMDAVQAPDAQGWSSFVNLVNQTYHDEDQSRYTMERSNTISTEEMEIACSA